MKLTLLVILLIGVTNQQCVAGCLKCNPSNACIICDVTNNFYLNGTTCMKSTVTNCQLISQAGVCVLCNNNYYLNPTTSLCVAVPTNNTVANCAGYSGTITCLGCLGNYFISAGACAAVNITVSNCASYSANGVCSQCNSGYIFSFNNSLCNAIPSIANCLSYTYGGCKACNSGFFFNPNIYLLNISPSTSTAASYFLQTGGLSPTMLSTCQATTVTNCVTFSSFNTCSGCATGYYLTSAGACTAFPLPVIQNCLTYSNLVTCSSCVPMFYLSANTCVAIIAIPFCATYSQTASSTVCTSCNSTSYVSGNACTNRTAAVNVASCTVYSLTSDICTTCTSGFILTSNSLLCLAVISNCATYQSWSPGQTSYTCATCLSGYYLNTGGSAPVCTAGTIANCMTYSSSTACSACNNGYYLVGTTTCTQHITIGNCLTYNGNTANTCNVCNTGYYLFNYYQTCIAATAITNCQIYSTDGTTCLTCLTGFYPTGSTCTAIPTTLTNCISYTAAGSGSCTGCSSGFILATISTSPACLTPVNYVTTNCDSMATWTSTTTWASTQPFCNVCKTNSIPYSPVNTEAICVLLTDLTAAYVGFGVAGVGNCVRYGLNNAGTSLVCMQCAATYVLSGYGILLGNPGTTSCVLQSSGCVTTGGANTILIDDFFGSVNICLSGSVTNPINLGNCQMAGRFEQQFNTQADLSCFQPINGYLLAFSNSGYFNYETIPSSTVSTTAVNGATNSVDFDFGYSTYDTFTTNFSPKVFNYRGVPTTIVQTSTLTPSTGVANCDIVFMYSLGASTNALGSAFQTGGAISGLYTALTAATAACMRCMFGYQPVITVTGTSGNNAVPVCTQMTNCASATTQYGGLPSFLNAAFSCHSCSASGTTATFPTLSVEFDASATTARGLFLQYYLKSATSSGFSCAVAPATITIATTAPATNNVVANCAAYGVLAAQGGTSKADPTVINNYCLACATGYYPFYFAGGNVAISTSSVTKIPNYAVIQCTASSNCATAPTNTPFNSCGACSTALANAATPTYFAYTDFRLINCLAVTTPNCFIVKYTSASLAATGNTCGVCMSGYFLNGDSYCDVLTIPNIGSSTGFVSSYYARAFAATPNKTNRWDNDLVRIHYLLSFAAIQYGASSCTASSMLAPVANQAPNLCVVSAYVTNNVAKPTGSIFITNCLKYASALSSSPNVYTCSSCISNFIPVVGGIACATTIANCVNARISPNTAMCNLCVNGYVNLNGVCSNQVIANCFSYVNTVNFNAAPTLACSICSNGYTLASNGTCILGLVANCNTYTNPSQTICTACASGFMLITLSSGPNYCYPIPSALSCNLLGSSGSTSNTYQQGVINCQSCIYASPTAPTKLALWSAQTTTGLAQNTCLPFNLVSNCLTYSQSSATLNQNTFACASCSSIYYLYAGNNTCILRKVQDPSCTTYVANADQCSVCATGYFVSSTTYACVAYPSGIAFCSIYTGATTCSMCNSGYYLSGNACLLSTVLGNCAVYSANYTCTGCVNNFYLASATSCVSSSATNCLTYASASACATCAFGSQLQTTSSITSCVLIVIANCAVLNPTTPTNCLFCTSGYYLNGSGVCTLVTTTISNCLYYATASTCNNCTAGNTLSVDMTKCTTYPNATDPNCANSILLGTPGCSQCNFGYTFQSGACTACSLFASGCLVCDQGNSTNCLLCKSGYYQIASSSCVAIPITNNTPVTPTSTAFLIYVKMLIFLGLLFVQLKH